MIQLPTSALALRNREPVANLPFGCIVKLPAGCKIHSPAERPVTQLVLSATTILQGKRLVLQDCLLLPRLQWCNTATSIPALACSAFDAMTDLRVTISDNDDDVTPKKSFLERYRTSKMPGLMVVPLVALAIVAGVFPYDG